MLRQLTHRWIVFGLCMTVLPLAISCSSGSKRSGSGGFLGLGGEAGYTLPNYEEKTLSNGLRILYVHDDKLPYVSYSLVVRGGATYDPGSQPGLAALVAELLDKGTAKRSAPQIANDLGQIGADFNSSASVDYSYVGASALSTQAEALLANLVEVVTDPSFPTKEIERARAQMLAQIERRIDNPGMFADLAWMDSLYGNHPYARPVLGTMKSVRTIRKKNIIQYYLRHYRPNNSILAVTGKFTPELKSKIESSFSAWQKRDVEPPTFGPVPEIKGVQIRLVDKPGLVQSQIRIGHKGIRRQNEDFLTLRVANTILGGAFASRLVDRVRKDLGLTYSINSHFDARQDAGPFEISTFTKNETTGQAVSEILKVLGEFKEKGVTKEEVHRAKGYLKGIFPTAIETPEKLAFNLLLLRLYSIPDTYLSNYLSEIDRIDADDVNNVIKKYIDEKNVRIVVYTSAPQVLPQLQPLGNVETKKATELR